MNFLFFFLACLVTSLNRAVLGTQGAIHRKDLPDSI